jgi:hypothetical protein
VGNAPHVRRAHGNVDVQHVHRRFSVTVTHTQHRALSQQPHAVEFLSPSLTSDVVVEVKREPPTCHA